MFRPLLGQRSVTTGRYPNPNPNPQGAGQACLCHGCCALVVQDTDTTSASIPLQVGRATVAAGSHYFTRLRRHCAFTAAPYGPPNEQERRHAHQPQDHLLDPVHQHIRLASVCFWFLMKAKQRNGPLLASQKAVTRSRKQVLLLGRSFSQYASARAPAFTGACLPWR